MDSNSQHTGFKPHRKRTLHPFSYGPSYSKLVIPRAMIIFRTSNKTITFHSNLKHQSLRKCQTDIKSIFVKHKLKLIFASREVLCFFQLGSLFILIGIGRTDEPGVTSGSHCIRVHLMKWIAALIPLQRWVELSS